MCQAVRAHTRTVTTLDAGGLLLHPIHLAAVLLVTRRVHFQVDWAIISARAIIRRLVFVRARTRVDQA